MCVVLVIDSTEVGAATVDFVVALMGAEHTAAKINLHFVFNLVGC